MSFNNYKLFRWNKDNILYHNNNNLYNDVYLHTGSIVKGNFENCACFQYINDEPKIISNSNHFINGCEWREGYNSLYKIFDNIVNNYKDFIQFNKNNNYDLDNEKTYFYMLNSFNFSNSGHDLSIILDYANYIMKNNIKDIIIYKNYKNTNNFKLITLLLPNDCNFIELNESQIYKIKNVIIIYQEFFNIYKHNYLIEQLITKIKNDYSSQYEELKGKNILLIKTTRNKNVLQPWTQLSCENMILELQEQNYINLIPEETDFLKLIIYLLFANKVVYSGGSIIYTNKIFINKAAKLLCFGYGNVLPPCSPNKFEHPADIKLLNVTNNAFTDEECKEFAKIILEY